MSIKKSFWYQACGHWSIWFAGKVSQIRRFSFQHGKSNIWKIDLSFDNKFYFFLHLMKSGNMQVKPHQSHFTKDLGKNISERYLVFELLHLFFHVGGAKET